MKLGEVFSWETDKAIGHELRLKYHIYVCEPDYLYGYTFLCVNKHVDPNNYPITKLEIPCLTIDPSYVSCSSPIDYTEEELSAFSMQPVAYLSVSYLVKLRAHIDANRTMVREHKQRITKSLLTLKG